MSCGAIDLGCHVAALLDPFLTWLGAAGAFIRSWWWLAYGAACMALGAHLGPVRTYAVISAGVVALIVRFLPQPGDEPDYETGESNMQEVHRAPKKKRTTIFDWLTKG